MPRRLEFPASSVAKQLKKVAILGSLPRNQLLKLARGAGVVAFERGETVVRRGDRGDGLYLILRGSAEVRRGRRRLARLGSGQFFGEMSLFDNEPRSADVTAVRPSTFAVLKKWEFWAFAVGQPKVLLAILAEMSRRLRAADNALAG